MHRLLIIASVGVGIITCVLQYYYVVQASFWQQQKTLEVLHKKEILYRFLQQDIQQCGCASLTNVQINHDIQHQFVRPELNHVHYTAVKIIPATVTGIIQQASFWLAPEIISRLIEKIKQGKIQSNSTMILLLDSHIQQLQLLEPIRMLCDPIMVGESLVIGTWLMLIDQQYLERFVVSSVYGNMLYHQAPINSSACFQHKYPVEAKVMQYQHILYFLGPTDNPKDNYLYRDNFIQPAECLMDGIQQFSVSLSERKNKLAQQVRLLTFEVAYTGVKQLQKFAFIL